MPRSKTQISKLPRDLKEPIVFARPSLLWSEEEMRAWRGKRAIFILHEHLRKLHMLMKELNAPEIGPQLRMFWLCIELAKELYPGFRLDSEGAKRKGRPSGAERGGLDDPQTQLVMVDNLREQGIAKSDLEACTFILLARDEGLKSGLRKRELERKAKSMASVVATLRASKKRKAEGKIH
jgi:hypothetical protein